MPLLCEQTWRVVHAPADSRVAHNSATHSVTQQTLFSLMMGYKPWAHPPLGKTFLPNLEKRLLDLSATREDAMATHKVAQQKMKEWFSTKFSPWKVRDKVWLEMTNLWMNRPKKLQMKWTGPFEIEQVISWTAYKLHIVMVRGWGLIFSIVHLLLLTVDSLFTFTILVIFLADTFHYIVW